MAFDFSESAFDSYAKLSKIRDRQNVQDNAIDRLERAFESYVKL